ncbi:MAG: hypothetical protein AAF214_11585, partial [Pseudomonadota bacterium]
MSTWDDLSDEQKTFVKRYLKKSAKDLFRKRHKSETNAAIISAYGDYAQLAALFATSAAAVPDDYPVRTPLMTVAGQAEAQSVQGNFTEAAGTITPAIAQMNQLAITLTDAADTLRLSVASAGEDGYAQSDKDRLATARAAVMQHLTDPLPTYAQMTAAQAAVPAYEAVVLAAILAMADTPAAQAALALAVTQSNPVVTKTINLDITPFASTPQTTDLAATVQTARTLQAAITSVPRDDATAMRALAGQLVDFATADDATQLVADATQHLVDSVTTQFAGVRDALIAGRDADLTRFAGETEHAQMTTLKGEIKADIAYIETHIASRDPDDIDAVKTRITQSAARATELATLQRTVGVRMTKADLASKGAKAAHQDGILKLMDANPDAADKVVESLANKQALLGGQSATPDFIRTKDGEVNALNKELTDLDAEYDALETTAKEKKKEQRAARKALTKAKVTAARANPITQQLIQARTAADQAHRLAVAATTQADQALLAKGNAFNAKLAEVNAAVNVRDAAISQRAMLDAITFGPLSPDAGRPVPAGMVADVVKLFDSNPALASQTCALAATAKDPASMTQTALMLADQCKTGFEWQPPTPTSGPNSGVAPSKQTMSDKRAAEYSKDILNRAAFLGADFAADARNAISRGVHFEENPAFATGSFNTKKTAALRSTEAAGAMMQTVTNSAGKQVVKIDMDSPAFNAVLDRQKFSEDGQFVPSTMLNVEMDKLKDFFGDPDKGAERRAEAETILNSVDKVPESPAARKLLEKSLGIPPADFDDPAKKDEVIQKVQTAILKSMMTPIAQGDVGSCFATAPLLKLRDENPIAVMEMYTDIATTGVFTPMKGRALPAVVNLPEGEDPLARSLEYSVAAASARLRTSQDNASVHNAMFNGDETLGDLSGYLKKKDWRKLEPKLMESFSAGYTFTYDPLAEAGDVSSDGSSDKGFIRMVDVDTQAPILTQDDFIAFVKRKAMEAATAAGLKDKVKADIQAYIDDQEFIDGVIDVAGKHPPWALEFGGQGYEAGEALTGSPTPKAARRLVAPDDSDTPGDRAVKVLKSLGGLSDERMTMVGTRGMHSFNALPPEG